MRRTGKKLVATVAGRKDAERPEALWQRLAHRVVKERMGPDQYDAGMLDLLVTVVEPDAGRKAMLGDIARGMGMLGYANRDGAPLDGLRFVRYVEQLYATREVLGASWGDDGTGSRGLDRVWGQEEHRVLRREFARAALQS